MPEAVALEEFNPWPKIPRLYRDVVITEKIDGTNAAVVVTDDGQVLAQSRKRFITPDDDNFGFARWVRENEADLAYTLGVGRHFGEWWGSGIQRGYGLGKGERRFSLFNTSRWGPDSETCADLLGVEGLFCVPVLWSGSFSTYRVRSALADLSLDGSVASPGFDDPEGVIVFHTAANQMFKVTLENDEQPKGLFNA
jgi:hypothetical protein